MHRMSSSQFPRRESEAADHASFEETYPRYEFAELVRLAVAMGAWVAKVRGRPRPDVSGSPSPGEMKPAE